MKFQGQLMYLIMEHLDKRSLENGVLSFTINDHAADFGPVEYFVVTGLPWGEMEELRVSSEQHHNIFQRKCDLRLSDLEKALTDTCKEDNGSGDLVLKLAYLVCVYGLLLSKDRKGKKLDIQYLHLIDDLSRFTSYPWGRISYEYLLHGVITARENMDRLKQKSNERPAFNVNGFTYALQGCAFEVFPSVGNHCGSLVDENSHLLPRILRWSTSTFFQYRDFVRFFQTGVEFKLVSLKT
ncbi:hypothetical protein C2S53_000525 [Perilla frutescens var. hirtella]|uniref:DUF1985 domain-containing protein n=1 Tax=Perilla frutescens var. hirtella TaxID=608512 RepID=A0AAD4JLR4_PERFH|nr:hypothetical protein C2S53_000525 [Perilla frutescens var. hirtella]